MAKDTPTEETTEEVIEKKETIEDVVREAHEDTEDTPEKETEEPVEEEVEEETPEETPEVDAQEIADAAKEKGAEEIKEEVLKALGVSKEEKDEAEEAGYKTPWEQRGEERPKNWTEAIEAGADLAEFRRGEVDRKVKEQENATIAQETKTREDLNKYWDKQLDDLRADGRLTDIDDKVKEKMKKGIALSKEEANDPGLVEQRELIQTMHTVGQARKEAGQDVIYNIKEIYYEHYDQKAQPAGEDAPVSGGKKTPIMPKSEDIDYDKDIKAKTMEDIIREG